MKHVHSTTYNTLTDNKPQLPTRQLNITLIICVGCESFQFDNGNDNDNILFDHNVQIEITIFNSLENQIINWSRHYY